ncbi:MAG: calcium/sodium antiporter [Thermodesulfobacteriota bacterium]
MELLVQFALIVTGFVMLVGGAEALVRGASALARLFGVSPLIIGLTVVAFGTSTPELAVNVTASLSGVSEIAFGNIVGSNIANIGLIVGLTALLKPLDIESQIISRELPMMLLASACGVVLGFDPVLRGTVPFYDRADGLILLLFFGVFLYYTIGDVLRKRKSDALVREASASLSGAGAHSYTVQWLLIAVGLAGLVLGGRVTVDAASRLALEIGISQAVVGLTVVAVGTSLPELATSLVATWRGQTDIAVGNVVGSNIFNLLFVAGLSATIRPIAIPAEGLADLLVMTTFAVVLLPFALLNHRRIVRREGFILLLAYVGYVGWRAMVHAG